jgi:Tol biopolymer transport system component
MDHPKESPKVFARDIISNSGTREGALSFAPDGKSLVFTKSEPNNRLSVQIMSFRNGKWTSPETWEQSNVGNSAEAFVSPDGNSIYFISNRHAPDEKGSGRIWHSTRSRGRWSTPVMIDLEIKTDKGFWFPTVSADQELYFGAFLDSIGNFGKSDIYVTDLADKTSGVRNLGPVINSSDEEWDPYISPDGSYLLFESDRPGGYGKTDIYVSFRVGGAWQKPINLGPEINTAAYEVAAKVSPDGKYIFFDRPMRDDQDILWVSADVLNLLRENSERETSK